MDFGEEPEKLIPVLPAQVMAACPQMVADAPVVECICALGQPIRMHKACQAQPVQQPVYQQPVPQQAYPAYQQTRPVYQ